MCFPTFPSFKPSANKESGVYDPFVAIVRKAKVQMESTEHTPPSWISALSSGNFLSILLAWSRHITTLECITLLTHGCPKSDFRAHVVLQSFCAIAVER
uniref:Ovule protein n=1 Tax=Steinernema glaseri TaxID=37863 RepID=A0A1I7XVH5_9BILA